MPAAPSIRLATALCLALCMPSVGAAQPVGAVPTPTPVQIRPRIGLALGPLTSSHGAARFVLVPSTSISFEGCTPDISALATSARLGGSPTCSAAPSIWGAWVESGSVFETPQDAVIHSDLSAGLLVDTVIGALLVSGSVVGDDRSPAFYVALGRPFW